MSNLELKVEKKIDEKSIEGLVSEKEITDNKIEKSLNYDELSKEEKAAIEEFNEKFDVNECEGRRLVCDKLNEQQATIEQLRQSQDVKEFSALFNQSIALQREIKDLKEENEQLKNKLNKGL